MDKHTGIEETVEASQAKQAMSQESYYQDLFNSVRDGIIVFDISENWDVVELNEGVMEMSGFTLNEFPRFKPSVQSLESIYTEQEAIMINEKAALGEPQVFEWLCRNKDGTPIWLEVVLKSASLGGQPRLVGILRDITLRKELTQKLEKALEAAEAANRAKDMFLANMSHELRTPLNGILGMAELLMASELNEKQSGFAGVILESATLLTGIINDILDYSRMDLGKMVLDEELLELRSIIELIARFNAEKASAKGIVLKYSIDSDVPEVVRGDPVRLRQVLLNLVGNAVKFTEQGEVVLQVKRRDERDGCLIVRFEVEDTGPGISQEDQTRVFEPFVQADGSTARRYGGTGLGLGISKALIKLMGGDIGVESRLGEGTTFWFELPFREEKPETNEGKTMKTVGTAPVSRSDMRISVLVAEDNPVNQQVITNQLENLGFAVELVDNGRDAVNAALSGRYGLVLMDVQMAGIDGFEATHRIRAAEETLNQHACIVAMTAHATTGDRERCLEAGMDDYISKPVSLQKLRNVLERWIWPRGNSVPASPGEVRAGIIKAMNSLERQGGYELAATVTSSYLKNGGLLLDTLVRAFARQDMKGVAKAGHELQSSSGLVGAERLVELSVNLTRLAGSGKTIELVGVLDNIRDEFATIGKELALFHDTRHDLEKAEIRQEKSSQWAPSTSAVIFNGAEILPSIQYNTVPGSRKAVFNGGKEHPEAGSVPRILVVDDDPVICDYLSAVLGNEGYTNVQLVKSGREAIAVVEASPPDAVILDWMLPDYQGPKMCGMLRSIADPAILMLTSKDELDSRVACLKAGADDYLTKPFRFEELLARLEALLRRRGYSAKLELLSFADVTVWPNRRVAYRNGRLLNLSPTEYNLLHLFMRHPNQVLSKALIFQHIWGYDFYGSANIIEVYIRYLRIKLENPQLIYTRRGAGYILEGGNS